MNKKQLINEIMDLYDENEALKNKLKKYETPVMNSEIKEEVKSETDKEKIIKELDFKAKDLLFDDVFYDWHLKYINIEVKEDSGEINFLTFDQWFKSLNSKSDIINSRYEYLLDNLTFNELKNYFRPQLENYFTKRVNDKKMEIVRSKKDE